MTRPVVFHDEVAADVLQAYQYYEPRQLGLGDRFLAALREAYLRIEDNPELYGPVWKTVRFLSLRRFPYGVFYQADSDRIYILAVYHTSRDPAGWQGRLPAD